MFKRFKELQKLENCTRGRLKELEDSYKELVEKQKILEHNTIILAEKNKDLTSLVAEEEKLLYGNKYNNSDIIINKLKELVHNYHTETSSK